MIAEDLEDFTSKIFIDSLPPVLIREVRPKDFIFYRLLEDKKESYLKLMVRLILNPEILDSLRASQFRALCKWMSENILQDSLMSPENWLEVAFHLNKQRWDSAIDWLEQQPMSKIRLMMGINEKVAEQQRDEIKKSRRNR